MLGPHSSFDRQYIEVQRRWIKQVAVNAPSAFTVAIWTTCPPTRICTLRSGSPTPLICNASPTSSCCVAKVHWGGIRVAVAFGILVGTVVFVSGGRAVHG